MTRGLPPKDLKNRILFRCSIRSKLRNNNPQEDSSYQKLNLPGLNRDGSSTAGASWPTRQKGEKSFFVLNIMSMSMSMSKLTIHGSLQMVSWEYSVFFFFSDWRPGRLYWQHVDKNSRGNKYCILCPNIHFQIRTPNQL